MKKAIDEHAVTIGSLQREGFTEHHLTILGAAEGSPEATLSTLAGALDELGARPFQLRLFGPVEARGPALAGVEAALGEAIPCAFLDGRAKGAGGGLSLRCWAATLDEPGERALSTVALPGGIRGRLLSGPGLRLLWLPELRGPLGAAVTEQAAGMFHCARAALEPLGLSYQDVVRTWISLRRILDWYGELNRVRTAFHDEVGLEGDRWLPASTGIQGRSGGRPDEECLMDLLALEGRGGESLRARPLLRSRRQDTPESYGSGFSRGVALEDGRSRSILISGTASVGSDGRTRYIGDAEAQALETLLSLAALLEPEGATLTDIVSGTLFYKTEEAREAYQEVTRLLGLPRLPLVPALADVCRPELLVEIEAIALCRR